MKGYVQKKIIDDGAILRTSAISEAYQQFQRMLNLSEKGDQNQNLKKRLLKGFGDKLSFFQRTPGSSELVYGTKDCKDKTLRTKESMIKDVARYSRASIEKLKTTSVWPPDPEDIRQGDIKIPELLQLFLLNLFTTESPVSERVHIFVKSLAQDMIYCVSRSRGKTVKYTELRIFIKKKTGCKQIVEALNRLGHCISYHEIDALETAYADSQVNHQLFRTYIPTGVQPSIFVTFVFNNCDHNPETLSGTSIHCANGIIIQMKKQNRQLPMHINIQNNAPITKRKSFTPVNMDILPYYQCERVHPTTMHHVLRHSNKEAELLSKKGDLLWALVRNQLPLEGEQQKISDWKGFYQEVAKDENKPIHGIHYLPAINQSPTKFDTVQKMLVQVKAKASTLGLLATDLLLDYAIYMKAVEVLHNRKNAKLRDFIKL